MSVNWDAERAAAIAASFDHFSEFRLVDIDNEGENSFLCILDKMERPIKKTQENGGVQIAEYEITFRQSDFGNKPNQSTQIRIDGLLYSVLGWDDTHPEIITIQLGAVSAYGNYN